jgi:paraquat-inducible protein B
VSARAHPKLIGAFVVAGVAIALAAVVLLGSGRLLERRERFVLFFPGSVQGLKSGAPLTFRGIPIGEVVAVRGFFTGNQLELQVEVVAEIWLERIQDRTAGARPLADLTAHEYARHLAERGIKAQLLSQSLLTGLKLIELDFFEESGRLTGLPSPYPELPTVPSTLERLGTQLADRLDEVVAKVAVFPFDEVEAAVADVRRALSGVADVVESGSVQRAADGVTRSAQELERALGEADSAVREISASAREELRTTGARARETLDRADRALASLERALESTEDVPHDAARALDELAHAAAALRELLDYLQRHPEALVSGKPAKEDRR